jgi:hypothetical protein
VTLTPLPSPNPGLATPSARPAIWNVLPFPAPQPNEETSSRTPSLPTLPDSREVSQVRFPASWPSPLTVLPTPASNPQPAIDFAAIPRFPDVPTQPDEFPETPVPAPTPTRETIFTDSDLSEALGPIIEKAVRTTVYARENGIDTHLEPMLRATIRRALAEYAPASRPFQAPGAIDRFVWYVQALFTSRSYEDIVFEKTRRFQVDEVFLLDATSLALISFASCDPARHSSARRVTSTVQRLAIQLRDDEGKVRPVFELADLRNVISRQGSHVILMAIVRGRPGELVHADLDFALRRIEDHFREQIQQKGSDLLYVLQPYLEDCLLIQAPASAA